MSEDTRAGARGPDPHRAAGGTVKIHGPGWLGGIEVSGQYVLAMLALVIMGLASGATALRSYRAAIAHGASLEKVGKASLAEHRRLTVAMDELVDGGDQTRCLLALLNEKERKDALRFGDVCAWIGVRPRRAPTPIDEGTR